MITCPACGSENAARARFCDECGAKLQTSALPRRDVRKTVTVLFADVVGSTALGERLDPETLRGVMGRYFGEARRAIEGHGGTIEKFIGDAVMAVFGIPVVHEDDALRAVRAASDMRAALAGLNAELGARNVAILVRIGINTGEVVAGDPAAGQTLVTGDAVNTAARLEQAAGAGEIWLGEATYRLARDAVTVEPVEPINAKGKALPLAAFRLVSVTPGAVGHARRLDAAMVGRERELARLQAAYRQAVEDRAPHLFTLLGSAGIGKSRLVAEFLGSLGGESTVLQTRCLSYGEGITYWPLGEIVRAVAGISDADTAEEASARVAALFAAEPEGERLAAGLCAAIGLSLESAPSEEVFWAARKLLERLARERPTLVLIEDIHWAEPTLLDLIEHVADLARDVPLFLLCPARPELLELRPTWAGGKVNASTLLLEPLEGSATAKLLDVLPGGAALPSSVRTRILEAAEGNPLYIEEMLGLLLDEGLIVAATHEWVAAPGLASVSVPPTVRALIAARLERLPGAQRQIAECASVVGRVFERAAVAELAPDLAPELSGNLLALVRKELVRPDRSDIGALDAFRFRHALIRDAAYEALPKEDRARLHQQFAAWLESSVGDRISEYEEIVGYHLEQAHRYRTELGETGVDLEDLGRAAGDRLHAVGKRALRNGDAHAAVDLLSRAVATVAAQDSPSRLLWELDLGEALGPLDPAAAHALLGSVVERARARSDERTAIRARTEQLDLERNWKPVGYLERVTAEVPALIDALSITSDNEGIALLHRLVARALHDAGQFTEASAELESALSAARRGADENLKESISLILLEVATQSAVPAADVLRMAEDLLPTVRAKITALLVRDIMAWARSIMGDLAEAAREASAVVRELRDLGQLGEAAMAEANSAAYALRNGDPARALALVASATSWFEQLGDLGSIAFYTAIVVAPALVELGRPQEALEVLDTKAAPDLTPSPFVATSVSVTRSEALLCLGRQEEAALAFDAISPDDLFREGAGGAGWGLILVRAARVACELDRPGDARRLAETARKRAVESGHALAVVRAESVLATLNAGDGASTTD